MAHELQIQFVGGARRAGRGGRAAGFTLIELLVSISIFVVVTGAVYGLLKVGTSDRFTTNQRSEMIQASRIALNSMSRDALNAGFDYTTFPGATVGDGSYLLWGIPNDADTTTDRLTPVVPSNDANANALNPVAGTLTDQVTFVSIDDTFNQDADGEPQALSVSAITGADKRTVTLAGVPSPSPLRAGDLYIISDASTEIVGFCTGVSGATLSFADDASSDPLRVNRRDSNVLFNLVAAPQPRLRRLRSVSYLVLADGTLVRRTAGRPNNYVGNVTTAGTEAYYDMPLCEGVENLQMEYLDSSGAILTAPTEAQRPFIRQVRVTLQVRSPERDRRTNDFFRTTLASTFNTRNIRQKA